MPDTLILSARRTAACNLLGELSDIPAPRLGAAALQAALADAAVDAAAVEEVLVGCVLPAGVGQAPARQTALFAGLPPSVPCTTVNKMCGSGMKTIMLADDAIRAGRIQCAAAGGIESMSNAPHLLPNSRRGTRLGDIPLQDHMFRDGLDDAYDGKLMGVYAQNTADDYGFTREEMDAFAIESLRRAAAAQSLENIVPVEVQRRKETLTVREDEQPRKSDIEKIPQLKPAFRKDGTVTAANSSSISDGAAMLILAADGAKVQGGADSARPMHPVARIVAQASHAETPPKFTVAPIGAIKKVLAAATWQAGEVDLYEINEAFAAVTMAAMRDLQLPHEKVNIHGGACALGHPVGASGARIVVTLLNALRATGGKKGVASLCIGGGEATALAIELL